MTNSSHTEAQVESAAGSAAAPTCGRAVLRRAANRAAVIVGCLRPAVSAVAIAVAVLMSVITAQPASAYTMTTHGAQVFTDVGCWSYGNRHLARAITITPESAYPSQWVRYRIWTYSYTTGAWVATNWLTVASYTSQPYRLSSNAYRSAAPAYYVVATEVQWYRGSVWTNSVTDYATYSQYTAGRLPVHNSETCYA